MKIEGITATAKFIGVSVRVMHKWVEERWIEPESEGFKTVFDINKIIKMLRERGRPAHTRLAIEIEDKIKKQK